MGSIKVNTINLARIAYENPDDWGGYFSTLKERVILCLQALDVIRGIITRNIEKGLLPNYTFQLINLKSQYNSIGILGIFEALQAYNLITKDEFGYTHYTDEGVRFAQEILNTINKVKDEFAQDKDYQINIEEVPAERAAAILKYKDQFLYPNQAYTLPLYGNQWIPLGVKTTLQEKIKLSATLDAACNGGSIAHINLDAPLNNEETAWNLLNYIADQGVMYFAFCTKISACADNHGFYGEVCPECGKPKITSYQRIVGFLTRESSYSKERKAEFEMRDWLSIDRMSEL